jgi:virginiamycin A acetyltransferase
MVKKEIKPIYPNANFKSFCYIKSVVTNPNIIVGDYSYYDDSEDGPESFEKHVTHHYDFIGDKLIIGKFCSIAKGVEFVMNGANHMLDSLTAYPFEIIDEFKGLSRPFGQRGNKGDTIVGNDVWIGQNAVIMPGVHIGDGAIIGANAVVAKDIPPYGIAVGNPAKVKRYRFDKENIDLLLKLKWWDKDIEVIKEIVPYISDNNIESSIKHLKERFKL